MSGSTNDASDRPSPPHEESNEALAKKSVKGGTITIVTQLCRVVIQIAGVAIVSKILAPADFGLLAMAVTVTGFISLFTDMGLSAATIQRKEINQRVISTLFFINLAVGTSLFLIAAAASPVAAWVFDDKRVIPLIISLGLAIPISAAGAQHAALLNRDMRWIALHGTGILSQLLSLVAVVVLALTLKHPFMALAAQSVVASLVATACYWMLSGWRPSFVLDLRKARSELGFGMYLSGFNFINYMHDQFDNLLLGWRFGAVELGYYSRAYSLLQMPLNMVNSAITQAVLPSLSRLAPRHDDWTRAFLMLLTTCAFGSMALCSTLFVASEPLIDLLLGHQWEPVVTLFRYLMVASIFGSATSVCGSAFISKGETKAFFYWGLFSCPIYALSYVIGLPWASIGIAVAYSLSMAVLAPIYLLVASRVTNFSFSAAAFRIAPFMIWAGVTCFLGLEILERLTIASTFLRLFAAVGIALTIYLTLAVATVCLLSRYQDFRELVARLVLRRGTAQAA